ncbi:MAG TPA: PilZ domain-containing protein, partial [Myxococcota bacterium]
PLDLWVEEEKGNELYFRRTGNVSIGGIYFEQTIPHALGTKVKLRFSLPGSGNVIEAAGEIVNTPQVKDGLGMGLRFTEVAPDVVTALQRFLDENGE